MSSDNADRIFNDLADAIEKCASNINKFGDTVKRYKRKRRWSMIRTVMLAAVCMGLGVGGASVDWESKGDDVVAWWHSPSNYTNYSDFFFWKQCDVCHNIFDGKNRSCCKVCGGQSMTSNVRARLLGTGGWNPDYAHGYQTSDGVLYIMKGEYLPSRFLIGSDLYTKTEAIVARNASLR